MPHDRGTLRILITGAWGFVGPYVADALRQICGGDVKLFPTGKVAGHHPAMGAVTALDVTDYAAVESTIAELAPSHVIHLAGIAAPVAASSDPLVAWQVNVHGTLNLARSILSTVPNCWLINVGSGLVYGESAKTGKPLDETTLLVPTDDYSVTKSAADLALGALVRKGLRCIRLRPFNHTGVGQTEAFVIPAFAAQIARIEAGFAPPVIQVGNLDAERDFLDVRDVAEAYALVAQGTETLESGTILNVASGIPRRISHILELLLAQSRREIRVEQDPARLRPSDLPRVVGEATHARTQLGWRPKYAFEDTLTAVLNDHRARLAQP